MLTQDEAELYDRQIRLWGVNAQSKIRQSKVLMLGFNGLASEVAKILVLAGIDTLTIVDDQPLQESDLTSNLFCRPSVERAQFRTHAVQSKLKTLNPLVNVNIENVPIQSKKGEDYKQYDLVTLHSFLTIEETSTINDLCRVNKTKFYVVLDYGFFGFMFNDLGPEFKFSYEEYNSAKEVARASGEEKDPISLEDDGLDAGDNGHAISDDDDEEDDEDDRPKKRRRLLSPNREVAETKVDLDEKQTKIGSLPYVPFQTMISLKNFIFSKKTSPVLLISIAMYRFYSQYKQLPRCENSQVTQDDLSKLNEIIVSMKDSLNLNDTIFKNLDKEWSDNIYGSLSPVCAVMGGVAGQDMIRALSSKDIPLHNTFAFDGISMNGIVEKMGLVDPEAATGQPCIIDFVQIDDDD